MDLKVVSGKTIQLPAEFFAGNQPTDPASPRVEIVDPNGALVVSDGVPVRERKGIYRYHYAVPASAPTGTWEAIWNATIDGTRVSASDLFEVQPAPAKASPPLSSPAPAIPAKKLETPERPVAPPAAKPVETPKAAEAAPSEASVPSTAKPPEKPGPPAAKTGERPKASATTPEDTTGRASKQKVTAAAAASKAESKPSSTKVPRSKSGISKRDIEQSSARKGPGKLGRKRDIAAASAVSTTGARGNTGAESSRKRQGSGDQDQAKPRTRLSKGKALLIIGALATVLAAIWFSPPRQDTVQAKIDQGVAAQKAGRTDEAQRLYEDVLQNDPNNKLANFNLGVVAQVAGDAQRAEDLYLKSLQADPDFLPALFNLAILQERADRNEESEETYRRLLEKYPDNGPAHLNYGFLLAQKLNRPDKGRTEFSRAVEIDPGLAARIPPDLRPAPAPAQ